MIKVKHNVFHVSHYYYFTLFIIPTFCFNVNWGGESSTIQQPEGEKRDIILVFQVSKLI